MFDKLKKAFGGSDEPKAPKVEEKVEDTKKEDKPSDDGEVKTFIDLIRSEGLL